MNFHIKNLFPNALVTLHTDHHIHKKRTYQLVDIIPSNDQKAFLVDIDRYITHIENFKQIRPLFPNITTLSIPDTFHYKSLVTALSNKYINFIETRSVIEYPQIMDVHNNYNNINVLSLEESLQSTIDILSSVSMLHKHHFSHGNINEETCFFDINTRQGILQMNPFTFSKEASNTTIDKDLNNVYALIQKLFFKNKATYSSPQVLLYDHAYDVNSQALQEIESHFTIKEKSKKEDFRKSLDPLIEILKQWMINLYVFKEKNRITKLPYIYDPTTVNNYMLDKTIVQTIEDISYHKVKSIKYYGKKSFLTYIFDSYRFYLESDNTISENYYFNILISPPNNIPPEITKYSKIRIDYSSYYDTVIVLKTSQYNMIFSQNSKFKIPINYSDHITFNDKMYLLCHIISDIKKIHEFYELRDAKYYDAYLPITNMKQPLDHLMFFYNVFDFPKCPTDAVKKDISNNSRLMLPYINLLLTIYKNFSTEEIITHPILYMLSGNDRERLNILKIVDDDNFLNILYKINSTSKNYDLDYIMDKMNTPEKNWKAEYLFDQISQETFELASSFSKKQQEYITKIAPLRFVMESGFNISQDTYARILLDRYSKNKKSFTLVEQTGLQTKIFNSLQELFDASSNKFDELHSTNMPDQEFYNDFKIFKIGSLEKKSTIPVNSFCNTYKALYPYIQNIVITTHEKNILTHHLTSEDKDLLHIQTLMPQAPFITNHSYTFNQSQSIFSNTSACKINPLLISHNKYNNTFLGLYEVSLRKNMTPENYWKANQDQSYENIHLIIFDNDNIYSISNPLCQSLKHANKDDHFQLFPLHVHHIDAEKSCILADHYYTLSFSSGKPCSLRKYPLSTYNRISTHRSYIPDLDNDQLIYHLSSCEKNKLSLFQYNLETFSYKEYYTDMPINPKQILYNPKTYMLHYTTPNTFCRKQLFSHLWDDTLAVDFSFKITDYNLKQDRLGVVENGEAYIMQLNMPTLKNSYESRIILDNNLPENTRVHLTNTLATIVIPSSVFTQTITYNISNEQEK